MVISDLDGTLLNDRREISEQDRQTLVRLGNEDILRVIATGRNLFSARKVLVPDLPIDYLIISSGAGIMEWSSQKLLHKTELPSRDAARIYTALMDAALDFMILHSLPDNHHFDYFYFGKGGKDFHRRLAVYRPFGHRIDPVHFAPASASQFIVIVDQAEPTYTQLQTLFKEHNVIRTTSPLDGKSAWIEIFPKDVSKSKAAQWLLTHLDHLPAFTLAIGNDYNDHDLLEWAARSYIVANAADDLKHHFRITHAGNNDHGFSEAVYLALGW